MEEQREEREFVGDCREPMEEKAKKGLALSSQTETLDGEDARTVEVLVDSGFGEDAKTVEVLVDSGVTDGNTNGGGSATETVSDEKQVKFDVASVEKTVSSDDVDVIDGSEICDDVQRVSKTAKLVEADVNDETAIAGAEESVISGGNEVKAKCEVEAKCGAYDGETHSVAEEKESAKKTEEEETPGPETKDAKHSESVPVLEESTQLSKEGTVSEFGSAADICREEERTNVNQKEGEAMELDCVLDNARNHLQNMMERGVSRKPLPTDLITEIFLRLPAKSVGRFRCLSKQWCSVLSGPDFIKLFLSRAHPRLLFAVERKGSWSFFSAPQPSSSSLVVTADFHSRFSEDVSRFMTLSYASGLFYFKYLWNPKVGAESLVCNPITGRYVILPEVYMYRKSIGFIGFDPIGKEYKVLAEGHPFCGQRDHHEVLTLGGTGELSWRPKGTDTPSYDRTVCEGICIDGILYYLVENFDETLYSIVRFDFRSEEFKVLAVGGFSDPNTTRLVNYKGKFGWIKWDYGEADGKYTLALRLWVLEDVEREKWSEYEYTLPENKLMGDTSKVSVAGVTATGEIVLVMDYTCKPYYIFYFNPKRNTLQSVEIQGFGAFEALEYRGRVTAFVDHVEDLNVDDAVQLKSKGVFANQVKHLCSNCEEQKKQERR